MERREVGIGAIAVAGVLRDEGFEVSRGQGRVGAVHDARQRQVVDALDQAGGAEAADAVPIAQAQQSDDGEVRPGRLAADTEPVGAELPRGVPGEPEADRLAVVGRGRVRMLRREAVLDRDDGDAAGERELLEAVVLQAGRAEHEAAAVEVEVDAAHVRAV